MNKNLKLTALEKNWILYDVGNSAFILLVATLVPIYFNSLASAAGVHEDLYLSYWGYAGSLATVLVALLGPVCGALADRKMKKAFFLLALLLGAAGCAALGLAPGWFSFLGIFILARVGYSASLVFYDSMLPEITEDARMDKVSSLGYAFGYIGSVIPFIVCLILVLMPQVFGLTQGSAMVIAFLITALWWIGCSLPLLRRYHQTAFVTAENSRLLDSFRQLGRTLKDVKREKHIFIYLLSFFFFIDGVYTIIDMATAYGAALGLDTTGLLLALLVTQIVAFPSALVFGRLSGQYPSGTLIPVCIAAYAGIALFAFFLKHQWQFWVLAVVVGMFQGGIQALSRSHFAKIIPPEKSGEYFGLFDICGKGASFLGTMIVSVGSQLTGSANVGVGSLIVLFIVGFVLFRVSDQK